MANCRRTATASLFILFLLGSLAACNTTAGIGEDVSAVGDAVTDSAEENKDY